MLFQTGTDIIICLHFYVYNNRNHEQELKEVEIIIQNNLLCNLL